MEALRFECIDLTRRLMLFVAEVTKKKFNFIKIILKLSKVASLLNYVRIAILLE